MFIKIPCELTRGIFIIRYFEMNKIKKVCGGAYFFFIYYLRKDDNRGMLE